MAASRPTPRKANATYNRNDPAHVTVDPKWLIKVLVLTVVAAFVCAYLAMCLLFWQGSWQLVLHPTHNAQASTGLPSEIVHFGPDAGGRSQITGEFLAANGDTRDHNPTVLYLRPGDGQLDSHDAPLLSMLHDLGLNVLAFDYRGYGRSGTKPRPSEERMEHDADSAYAYLTGLRNIPSNRIIVYGAGVGASLAVSLASMHADGAGLILRNASADLRGAVRREPRSRFFPIGLLFHDPFQIDVLSQMSMPKLLLDVGPTDVGPEERARQALYRSAKDPKMTVELPNQDPAAERQALKRFLDERVGLLPAPVLLPQLPAAK